MTSSLTNDKPWTLPQNWCPGQFHHLHRFVVVGTLHRRAVQGAYSHIAALHACEVLNEHNAEHGHAEFFEVLPIPVRLHNQPPSTWDLPSPKLAA